VDGKFSQLSAMKQSPSVDGTPRHVVLLPGMHGTGELFSHFVLLKPLDFDATIVALPQKPLSYSDLERLIEPRIPGGVPFVLLGESFSGPLAIRLAAKRPPNLRGLILCNSFVSPPRAACWKLLPWRGIFHFPLSNAVVRRYLAGGNASDGLIAEIRETISHVSPQVLASRVRTVLTSNSVEALRACEVPILYLRGTADRLVPDSAFRTIVAIVPSAKRCDIPGPHMVIQVNPREVWQAITEFVATCLLQ
jgi:pimeloyl-[acyl-carrier protein] methyl ester esterase